MPAPDEFNTDSAIGDLCSGVPNRLRATCATNAFRCSESVTAVAALQAK